MNEVATLLTSRLVLRPLRADDAPHLVELAGNWNVARMTRRIPHPYLLEQAQEFIEQQRKAKIKGDEWTWAICLKDGLSLIGCIGVTFGEMDAELGYWLGEPYWGQGYATEAGRAIVDHVFNQCELWEMNAVHLFQNQNSGRVLTKLGFQVIGFKQGTCREAHQDLVQHQLLHAAWVASPEREGFTN